MSLLCNCLALFFLLLFASVTFSERSLTNNQLDGHTEVSQNFETSFNRFIAKYKKQYNESEYNTRFEIFKDNLKKIDLLNKEEQGTAIYGVTKFADLTEHEFKKWHTGLRADLYRNEIHPRPNDTNFMNTQLPQSFDWRSLGAVTDVKDQGFCGSCWAFSTSGNIEGQYAIVNKKLISLSEQELVDCDKYDFGCSGGLMTNAYKTIIEMGGLETESEYPYDGKNEKCHFNTTAKRVNIDSYVVLPENETQLAQWLTKHGPISIGINAVAMQFYFGGISHPKKWFCDPSSMNHGVLIVGFGVGKTRILRKTLPFWIVKNSWGKHWGEKGYYRVYRGDGTCGLNKMATSAWINH
ncbi:cathepsin L-like protein [Leptotrombidium deliense]|uniref:Cathepsin L-like protein n=1 Tax=Leptotrombidium deliense TaxID=299467 RepID=A0A443SLS5_9ACAR|nr:cathepsin L-like protein [Leptotrombidium deliense]